MSVETASSPPAPSDTISQTPGEELVSIFKTIVVFVAVAILLRGTVVEAFKIPSSSMETTLLVGDHILVNKLSYGIRLPFVTNTLFRYSAPARGDIVVFTRPDDPATPEDDSETNVIKRVIGLPGDRLEVRGTSVYINGELYREDDRYARWIKGGTKSFLAERVPDNTVVLLGDNRDSSLDSRFWTEHFLSMDRIKGRAFIIYFNSEFDWRRFFKILR